MASGLFSSNNEETVSDGPTGLPVLREMLDELQKPPSTTAQPSNIALSTDDLLINHALGLTNIPATDISTEATSIPNQSSEKISDTIVDALVSSSKRISIELNDADASITTASDVQSPDSSTTVTQAPLQPIPNVRTAIQTLTATPTKKKHIMISYSRSCEAACQQIRSKLRELKYKVWMDVFDMPNNLIDGMAKAIGNSYIVLLCINQNYDKSYWCKREAQYIAIKQINYIPCFMEAPTFPLEGWLDMLVAVSNRVDFSSTQNFDESFEDLLRKINLIEEELAMYPRDTPPTTPADPLAAVPASRPTQNLDDIMRSFKTWIEDNRQDLRQCNREESNRLISELVRGLQSDPGTADDKQKKELLKQLLSSTTHQSGSSISQFGNDVTMYNNLMIKGLLFIMALWAVRVVFQKK